MAWGPLENDLLQRKYAIMGQQANADTTRANAAMQGVQQQPGMQAATDAAAMERARLAGQTQLDVAGIGSQTQRHVADQNFGLGQAQLGLAGVQAASEDQYKRASLTKPVSTYDPETGLRGSTSGFNWATDFSKLGVSPLQTYLNKANTPMFEAGGLPPVNRPFIAGEKGPELFIPGDGSDPMVIGANGPTVMTVPKRGEILPNAETRKIVPEVGGLPGGDSSPPWANVKPGSAGPRLSADGVVLPQQAAAESAQPGLGLSAGMTRQAPQSGFGLPGGGGTPAAPEQSGGQVRYVNVGQAWQQDQEAARQAYQAAEKGQQPEFTPERAIAYLGNLDPKARQEFMAGLSQNQLDALAQHRLQQKNFDAVPMQLGKRPAAVGGLPGGNVVTPEQQAAIDTAMGQAVETGDATNNPNPRYSLVPEGFQVEGSLARFVNGRRAAGEARAKEVDIENEQMQAKKRDLAGRAIGLGSYFITTPDTASFRR